MMYVGALISFLMTIPAFCGFVKKTPDLVGHAISWCHCLYIVGFMITADHIEAWFGLNELTKREWADAKVAIGLVSHMVITAGFFCLTTLFRKPLEEQRQKDVDKFFNNLATH